MTRTVVLMLPVDRLPTPVLVTLCIRVMAIAFVAAWFGPLDFPVWPCPFIGPRLVVPPSRKVVGGAPALNANDPLVQQATMAGIGELVLTLRAWVPNVP